MRNITKLSLGLALATALTGAAFGQQTTTTTTTSVKKVVQNGDGTYSVIEYPTGKEVVVDLTPSDRMMTAKGLARVMRMNDQTTVNLDLNGLDSSNYYVYAVDPSGNTTYLGPVTGENGIAKTTFTTPLNQFMLVLSPNEGLTSVTSDTPVVFRSAVPKGYAVVNNMVTSPNGMGKQVAMTQTVTSTYDVPLLGVPSFSGKTTETRINFSGTLEGLKGKAYVKARKDGTSQIKMRFDDLKLAPKDKRYVLWAVSPEKTYTKIGQIINTGAREEGEIRGETAYKDFGLFVTVEDADVTAPTSTVYSPFTLMTN